MRKISRRKRLLFILLANVLALGLLAIGGEVACRLLAPQAHYGALPDWILELLQYSDDIYLGWELRPGTLDHNSAGIRGPEYTRAKPPGTWRIAFIGDSVTYGLHVEGKQTFAHLLEEQCNRRGAGPVEILNFGVPGYNPFQEYEMLKTRAGAYHPDLVVMVFSTDDVETSPVVMNIGGEPALFRNQFEDNRLLNNALHWTIFRHSHLYRLLYKSAALSFVPAGNRFDDVYVQPRVEWENVRRVAQWCREHQTRFLLVLSPYLSPYEPEGGTAAELRDMQRYDEAFDVIRQLARQDRLDVVDLGPLYKQHSGQMKIRRIDHEHLNPEGHRLVAEYLLPRVIAAHAREIKGPPQ